MHLNEERIDVLPATGGEDINSYLLYFIFSSRTALFAQLRRTLKKEKNK